MASFWVAYILTRPLGASLADWLGKPASFGHGLGYGDGPVALVLTVLIVIVVTYTARTRHGIQTPAPTATPRLLYHFAPPQPSTALIPNRLHAHGRPVANLPPVL